MSNAPKKLDDSSSFSRTKHAWLDQVLRDPELPPLTFVLAYVLSRFINIREGYAWPSVNRLALECHVTENGVKKAIKRLIAHGHLQKEVCSGRGHTNRYRWILREDHQIQNDAHGLIGHFDEHKEKSQSQSVGFVLNDKPPTSVAPLNDKRATEVLEKGNDRYGKGQQTFNKRRTVVAPIYINRFNYKKSSSELPESETELLLKYFNSFWEIYPKNVSQPYAMRAFASALKRASFEEILAGAQCYASQRQGKDPQYTRNPARWLDGDGWRDPIQNYHSVELSSFVKKAEDGGCSSISEITLDGALASFPDLRSKI